MDVIGKKKFIYSKGKHGYFVDRDLRDDIKAKEQAEKVKRDARYVKFYQTLDSLLEEEKTIEDVKVKWIMSDLVMGQTLLGKNRKIADRAINQIKSKVKEKYMTQFQAEMQTFCSKKEGIKSIEIMKTKLEEKFPLLVQVLKEEKYTLKDGREIDGFTAELRNGLEKYIANIRKKEDDESR